MGSRVFVIGCGSIGMRHIRNLRHLGVSEMIAFDPISKRLEETKREANVLPCRSVGEGLSHEPEIVLICTPPNSHLSLAQQAIEAGCHVFIEKPLGERIDSVDELLTQASNRNLIVYVGYNLRFHRGLRRVKEMLDENRIGHVISMRAEFGQYLPDWRPHEDYRDTYSAKASMGGGIILDASHELDYVRWLVGEVKSVYCVADKLSNLKMDVEDIAEITLRIQDDVIAQVHVDCIQRGYSRSCKLVGEKGTLIWDYTVGVQHYDGETDCWKQELIALDPNEMYIQEINHFLACVRGEDKPIVDGKTGKRVLEIALAAKTSAIRNEVIYLGE